MVDPGTIPIAAIIPAAGQGTRLGGQTKKQFKHLAGKPLLLHTLVRIIQAPNLRWLIVAVPESHLEETREMIEGSIPREIELILVAGGSTRQQSVANALAKVPQEALLVMVHDAARPVPDPAWITQSAALCQTFDGAIVALPSQDTLKEVADAGDSLAEGGAGVVKATIAREVIWQAQTPQTFRTAILRKAMAYAREKGITGTDESFLVESIGGKVAIIKGSPQNIKITSRSDWDYMEWRLAADQDRNRY